MDRLILSLLVSVVGCASTNGLESSLNHVEVESWETVDPAEMNTEITGALAEGEEWPRSPLAATVQLLGGDTDAQTLQLEEHRSNPEGVYMVIVVLVRDGFLGDSVRGDWHRIAYESQPDGTWRIRSVQRAFRCYRGHHKESFSREWCL